MVLRTATKVPQWLKPSVQSTWNAGLKPCFTPKDTVLKGPAPPAGGCSAEGLIHSKACSPQQTVSRVRTPRTSHLSNHIPSMDEHLRNFTVIDQLFTPRAGPAVLNVVMGFPVHWDICG